jgi:phage-related protein
MRALPEKARRGGGFALGEVQRGETPPDWKPMSSVGLGVREIRIRTGREFRVLYVVNRPECIYVLHVFEKKTRRTSWADIEIGRRRFASLRERT